MTKTPEPSFQVPEEMKKYPQWVAWGKNGNRKNKVPYSPKTYEAASSIKGSEWGTYGETCEYALNYGFAGIGFMLHTSDPYAFIDLDDPGGNQDICEQQKAIYDAFPSYAERSPSGSGLHIIVKGRIPRGRRRNKIEVYSQARYMTMSGDIWRNVPIVSCQQELVKLYQNLGGHETAVQVLDDEAAEIFDDETIIEKASSAANGQKFKDLWAGEWHEYYPDEIRYIDDDPSRGIDPNRGASCADFALIDILAFYSQSRKQVTRLFRASELGKRKKTHRRDYMEWMLNKCYDRYLPPVDLSYLKDNLNIEIAKVNIEIENKASNPKMNTDVFTFPPGLVGEIAQFIYDSAPRQVSEIALTGALGLMSGVCGRAFNVSSTGLNQYYLLLADTGTGKEAMASGIEKLMGAVGMSVPAATDFIGPGEMASSQGLIRYLNDGFKSFVSVLGEFALLMRNMTAENAPAHMVGLRRILLDLYNKSGNTSALRPSVYADKAKNTDVIRAPAVSFIGESTPGRFYEILNENMISEGLLPRFLNIEYLGKRPSMNYAHADIYPSQQLIDRLGSLCCQAHHLNVTDAVTDVHFDETANRMQAQFNEMCDRQINASRNDVVKQLWNRAHLKSLKLSALVAVGINHFQPVICEKAYEWAKAIVVADCMNIIARFESGDVGRNPDEGLQVKLVIKELVRFVVRDFKGISKTGRRIKNCQLYHSEKVIPFSYLQRVLSNKKQFKDDRRGATRAVKEALDILIQTGEISEMGAGQRKSKFGAIMRCFIIENEKLLSDVRRRK